MLRTALDRRRAFAVLGGAAALTAMPRAALAAGGVQPSADGLPGQAASLTALSRALSAAPRRRGFDTVPFMIDRRDLWDHEAAELLLAYRGSRRQMWESSDITAPWLNLMREALNGQVFAHGHPDFLAVAAVHGTAHLALFGQAMWDTYGLAANTGGKLARNDLLTQHPGVAPADDRQKVDGFYGAGNNNIVTLQRRGAVMVACHDSIHAIARGVAARSSRGDADGIAADLTNNLVEGVVLVPSVVAFIVELQQAGFTYAKAS